MDFDFSNDTITPDSGSGVIIISGTGGLIVPSGATADRPVAAAGLIRFNTTTIGLEVYNGSAWASVAGSGGLSSINDGTASTMTAGSIVFSNGTALTQNNAKLFWDNTNFHLGIGTSSPGVELDVLGDISLRANTGATAPSLRLYEDQVNGTHFIQVKAPPALTASYTLTYPSAVGPVDGFMTYDGASQLNWGVLSNDFSHTTVGNTTTFSIDPTKFQKADFGTSYSEYTDFCNAATSGLMAGFNTAVSGTGAGVSIIASDDLHPGILQIATGTTAAGRGTVGYTSNLSSIRFYYATTNVFDCLVKLPVLSTATQRYTLRAGFGDSISSDFTDGAYFEYIDSASQYWQICLANNSGRTKIPLSSINAVQNNIWYRLKVVVNGVTNASFYINDVLVGTLGGLPAGSGRESSPLISFIKSIGTTSSTCHVDYMALIGYSSIPRY